MSLIRKILSLVGRLRDPDEESEIDPYVEHMHENLREEIVHLALEAEKLSRNETYRILVCCGPRDGKSSLINNILSALDGRLVQVARHGDNTDHVTQKYLEYRMTINQRKSACETKFVLCDTCGAQKAYGGLLDAVIGEFKAEDDMKVVSKDDSKETGLREARNAHAKIIPSRTGSSSGDNRSDRRSAVAILFVVSTDKLNKDTIHNATMFDTIQPIVEFANTNGIPIAFFITKCDIKDDSVHTNIKVLYKSKTIKEARSLLHFRCHGFPLNRIFPIVNYTYHMKVTPGMIIQTLYAMKHVMTDIHDYLSKATFRV